MAANPCHYLSPLIPEDMLHLMKGEANYLVLFYYLRASLPNLQAPK